MLIQLNAVWYHYCAIDAATVDALLSADSIGNFYNQNIGAGAFDCRIHPAPEYPQ